MVLKLAFWQLPQIFLNYICYSRAKKTKQKTFKSKHWKKQNKHAMGKIIWSGFNTFILTQAGRRRATHFVKLVSSQVKKIEKWSGLAIKQLDSCCVPPPPEQMEMRPVLEWRLSPSLSQPSPSCVIVWRRTGHAWEIIGQHAAGWFQGDTMRRRSTHQTRPPWMANTDDVQIIAQNRFPMQQTPWWFFTKHGSVSFHRPPNKAPPPSPPLSPAHPFLRRSKDAYFYMQIYTRYLWSWMIFSWKNQMCSYWKIS